MAVQPNACACRDPFSPPPPSSSYRLHRIKVGHWVNPIGELWKRVSFRHYLNVTIFGEGKQDETKHYISFSPEKQGSAYKWKMVGFLLKHVYIWTSFPPANFCCFVTPLTCPSEKCVSFSRSISSSLWDKNFGLHSRKHLSMCNSLNFNMTIHEHRVSTYLIAFLNGGQNRDYLRSAWEKGLLFIILIKIAAPLRRISQKAWKDLGLLASTSLESEAITNKTRIACACTTQRERNDMRIDPFMLIFFLDVSPRSAQF